MLAMLVETVCRVKLVHRVPRAHKVHVAATVLRVKVAARVCKVHRVSRVTLVYKVHLVKEELRVRRVPTEYLEYKVPKVWLVRRVRLVREELRVHKVHKVQKEPRVPGVNMDITGTMVKLAIKESLATKVRYGMMVSGLTDIIHICLCMTRQHRNLCQSGVRTTY